MNKTWSVHVDRCVDALAHAGVRRKRSKVAEMLATTLGFDSSNHAMRAALEGDLDPPAATRGGTGEGLVVLHDPVAGRDFGVSRPALDRARGTRCDDFLVSPYGNLLDVSGLREAHRTLPVAVGCVTTDRAAPTMERAARRTPFMTHSEGWIEAVRRNVGLYVVCGDGRSWKSEIAKSTADDFRKRGGSCLDMSHWALHGRGRSDVTAPSYVGNFALESEGDLRRALAAVYEGHTAIATMSAPGIANAIDRMADMVPRHELRTVLRGVLAQRRMGALCRDCHGKPTGPSPCGNCDGQGYDGGLLVSECVTFDTDDDADDVVRRLNNLRDAVETKATLPWDTMMSDAVARMRAGETSSDEIIRAFGAGASRAMARLGIDPAEYAVGRAGHEA